MPALPLQAWLPRAAALLALRADGLRAAAGFIKGWLEAREIDVVDHKFGDLHALSERMFGPNNPMGRQA